SCRSAPTTWRRRCSTRWGFRWSRRCTTRKAGRCPCARGGPCSACSDRLSFHTSPPNPYGALVQPSGPIRFAMALSYTVGYDEEVVHRVHDLQQTGCGPPKLRGICAVTERVDGQTQCG